MSRVRAQLYALSVEDKNQNLANKIEMFAQELYKRTNLEANDQLTYERWQQTKYKKIKIIFQDLENRYAILMDVYTLARMFRQYKGTNHKKSKRITKIRKNHNKLTIFSHKFIKFTKFIKDHKKIPINFKKIT